MRGGQTSGNSPEKRRESFTAAEEGVILQPAENCRCSHFVSENQTMRAVAEITAIGKLPEYVRRVRSKGHTYYYFRIGRAGRYSDGVSRLPDICAPDFAARYEEALAERTKREAESGIDRSAAVVYFIAAEDGPIKIGWCKSLTKRLRELQCGNPERLSVLATSPGRSHLETEYHQLFAAHRLNGEWFKRHPDILAEIERLSA